MTTDTSGESSWVHRSITAFPAGEWPEWHHSYTVVRRSNFSKSSGGTAVFFSVELHAAPTRDSFRVVSRSWRNPRNGNHSVLAATSPRDSNEARMCQTMSEAIAVFGSLVKEATSPLFRFVPAETTTTAAAAAAGAHGLLGNSDVGVDTESALSAPVQEIVRMLFAEAAEQLMGSGLGCSVCPSQVDRAISVLMKIKGLLGPDGKVDRQMAMSLSREFHSTLPMSCSSSSSSNEVIDTVYSLERWLEMCRVLRDVSDFGESMPALDVDSGSIRDVDALFRSLSCDIAVIDADAEEFRAVSQLISSPLPDGLRLNRVFRLRRDLDAASFTFGLPNQRLMFHGTKPCNLLGIVARGMMLPDIVVSKYGVVRTNAGMLGAGIYFSDDCRTSLKYTEPSSSSGSRFLVVCCVALGNCADVTAANPSLVCPPPGYDSVHGVRRRKDKPSEFADDEFVIYTPSQQHLRYLVEFSPSPVDSSKGESATTVVSNQLKGLACVNAGQSEDTSKGRSAPVNSTDPKGEQPSYQFRTRHCLLEFTVPPWRHSPSSVRKYGLQSSSGETIALEEVSVHARLVDVVAEVVLFQQYTNSTGSPLEAKYVFPLDEMSAVTGFEAWINSKHVVGVVKEKEKAHREYREAVERGDGAYLLDEAKDNVFTVSIGNIPAKTRVVIKIVFITELGVDGDARKFVLPAALVPHQKQSALSTHTQNVTQTVSIGGTQSFSMEISLNMPGVIQQVASPSHTVLVKKTSTQATVRWIEEQPPGIDFVLLARVSDTRLPFMWVEESDLGDDCNRRAAMVVLYPDLPTREDSVAEYIVLMDLSNSMKSCIGDSKRVALGIIEGVPDFAPLNVIGYGSSFESAFITCRPKSVTTNKKATRFIEGSDANRGASFLWPALNSLLLEIECREGGTKGVDTNVFVVTDGDFASPEEVIRLVTGHCQREGNRTRVFVVAMGPTPHRHNATALARSGCGAVEYVGPSTPLRNQDKKQLTRATQPSLGSIDVEWGDGGCATDLTRQAPQTVQSIFTGERAAIFGLVPSGCSSAIVTGVDSARSLGFSSVATASPASVTTGLLIHRLCTRAIVRDWEACKENLGAEEAETKKQEVIELGVRYSLATPLTSFIAVEERSEEEKRGLAAVKATPPLKEIDTVKVDGIPFCSNWTRVEKETADVPTTRPKIGEGIPAKHATVYDYWEPAKDTTKKLPKKPKKSRRHRHRRTSTSSESEPCSDGDYEEDRCEMWEGEEEYIATRAPPSQRRADKPAEKRKEVTKKKAGKRKEAALRKELLDTTVLGSFDGMVSEDRKIPEPTHSAAPRSSQVQQPAEPSLLSSIQNGMSLKKTEEREKADRDSKEISGKDRKPAPKMPPPPAKPRAAATATATAATPTPTAQPIATAAPMLLPTAPNQIDVDKDMAKSALCYYSFGGGGSSHADDILKELESQAAQLDAISSNIDACAMEFRSGYGSARKMSKKAACFVATAAYGSTLDPHVDTLRWFRDHVLARSAPGRLFIREYYSHSPPFAKWLACHPMARLVVRVLLWPVVAFCDFPVQSLAALAAVMLSALVAAVLMYSSK